jgi:hypothetical protein
MNELHKNRGYQVLTPSGWQDFAGVAEMGVNTIYRVLFENGKEVRCSDKHVFVAADGDEVYASDLVLGMQIGCEEGQTGVVAFSVEADQEMTLSLIEVEGGHLYYTNGIASRNCEFVSDEESLVNPMMLAGMKGQQPSYYTETVRWYKELEPNMTYLVALDPSVGTGGDYAAIQVFESPSMIQVAEWQHNMTDARGQIKVLMKILHFIDQTLQAHPRQMSASNIFWTVENNTIGETVLLVIADTGEDKFPGTFVSERKKKGRVRRFRKGMLTDQKRKLAACARMKSLIESNRMRIRSAPLVTQLKSFVARGGSYAGKPGQHDDLVSACLLIVRMLESVTRWDEQSSALSEQITEDEVFSDPMPVVI